MAKLVLGPVLRYVGETSATVWVETDTPCEVEIAGGTASTFTVAGHHYALVVVDGLAPGTSTEYRVHLDGEQVWPPPGHPFPPSRIRTLPAGSRRLRLLFGSCRAAKHNPPEARDEPDRLGPDALDAYAARMATLPEEEWPDMLLLLGDQVYADEPTPHTQEWLRRRHQGTPRPDTEVVDFVEYAHLYHETWSDPEVRWLLSTVPTSMIFDDHDVRDDWNTSATWRRQMATLPWWRDRIRGALSSYWVYQHLGNLDPAALAADETYAAVRRAGAEGRDALPVLLDLADRADSERDGHKGTRWSFRRDLGSARLLVVDTRCGRILEGGRRSMLGDEEFAWLERNAEGDYDHLLVGSSLPWILPHVISHLQSLNEVACRRPGWRGRVAEWLRQLGDLEHWPSFRASFDRLTRLVRRVAEGRAGERPPATVCVLSGDVHHSYLADVHLSERPDTARVVQLTCSPVHNEPPRYFRPLFRIGWSRPLGRLAERWARRAGVPPLPLRWTKLGGPYFGNMIGLLTLDGPRAEVTLEQALPGRDPGGGRNGRLAEVVRLPLTGR
ncbi:MAG TPA: alkaline phosphatase D family protein [Pseudonocardiaceae bacterium]